MRITRSCSNYLYIDPVVNKVLTGDIQGNIFEATEDGNLRLIDCSDLFLRGVSVIDGKPVYIRVFTFYGGLMFQS